MGRLRKSGNVEGKLKKKIQHRVEKKPG